MLMPAKTTKSKSRLNCYFDPEMKALGRNVYETWGCFRLRAAALHSLQQNQYRDRQISLLLEVFTEYLHVLASLLYWEYSGKLRGLFPLMYIDNKVIDESGDCAKQQGVK